MNSSILSHTVKKVTEFHDLTSEESEDLITKIAEGKVSPVQLSSVFTSLKMKGESAEELSAFLRIIRKNAVKFDADDAVDCCGTGGDYSNTFNISTCAAFVAAGAGVRIVKHGNRAISSGCGSADLLEKAGAKIDIPPEMMRKVFENTGFCFLFAPLYHPVFKAVMPVRKELGIKTFFNILGPLSNPANLSGQLFGVFDEKLTEKIAFVLNNSGRKRAMIVHGYPLDEISLIGKTKISELKNGRVETYFVEPEEFGFKRCRLQDLQTDSLKTFFEVLDGKKGPSRDIVLLNAGAVIYIAGKAGSMKEGIELAEKSIDSGSAKSIFENFKK